MISRGSHLELYDALWLSLASWYRGFRIPSTDDSSKPPRLLSAETVRKRRHPKGFFLQKKLGPFVFSTYICPQDMQIKTSWGSVDRTPRHIPIKRHSPEDVFGCLWICQSCCTRWWVDWNTLCLNPAFWVNVPIWLAPIFANGFINHKNSCINPHIGSSDIWYICIYMYISTYTFTIDFLWVFSCRYNRYTYPVRPMGFPVRDPSWVSTPGDQGSAGDFWDFLCTRYTVSWRFQGGWCSLKSLGMCPVGFF